MKLRIWHIIVFVLALLIFAVVMAPAAFFVRQHPDQFTYERAHGSVWSPRLEGVQIGPYQAASASWRIFLFDLLGGRIRAPIDIEDGTIEGHVMLLANVYNDRRLFIPRLRLEGVDLGARGVWPGEIRIRNLDIFFDDGVCTNARGGLYSDVFVRAAETLQWQGPPITGDVVCEGEDAVANINGRNAAGEEVVGRMVLRGDGSGEWRLGLQNAQPETAAALAAAGLQADNGEIGDSGNLRWLP